MASSLDPEIGKFVARLDEAVPRQGAWVTFVQYGGGPEESAVYASRLGYLRLGIEFLKAGLNIPESAEEEQYVEVDLSYLADRTYSQIFFDYFKFIPSGQRDG